jgi:hypothetical protein
MLSAAAAVVMPSAAIVTLLAAVFMPSAAVGLDGFACILDALGADGQC